MFNLETYPDAWVMLRPSVAYAGLIKAVHARSAIFKRPLLVAFVFGCAISLMTSGRVTLRLAGPATIYWTFLPLFEIGALALVAGPSCRKIGWARSIDLFFRGHAPWLLLLIVYTAMWAFLPPISIFANVNASLFLLAAICFVAGWSAYVDYHFFRVVLSRTHGGSLRDLVLQRTICWLAVLAWFVGPAAVQVVSTTFGL